MQLEADVLTGFGRLQQADDQAANSSLERAVGLEYVPLDRVVVDTQKRFVKAPIVFAVLPTQKLPDEVFLDVVKTLIVLFGHLAVEDDERHHLLFHHRQRPLEVNQRRGLAHVAVEQLRNAGHLLLQDG